MSEIVRSIMGVVGVLVFLAATHGGAYFKGVANERADNEARAARVAIEASERVRQVEHERLRAREIVEVNHAAEMDRARRAAAAVRGELARLRDALADRDRGARDAGATGRADDAAPERELLGECAAAYQELAGTADGLAGQVRGLQGYVRDVVLDGR